MPETRTVIVKFKIEQGNKGLVCRLWQKGDIHPEFLLFSVSDLQEAGLDWTKFEKGVEHPCRFFAVWEYGEKQKSTGTRYKNVLRLEPIAVPAIQTDTTPILTTILDELLAVKAIVRFIAGDTLPDPEPEPKPDPKPDPEPTDPEKIHKTDEPDPPSDEPDPPSNDNLFGPDDQAYLQDDTKPMPDIASEHFDAMLTHLTVNKTITVEDLNRLADQIIESVVKSSENGARWTLATTCLKAEIDRRTSWTGNQLAHRVMVVERLQILAEHKAVKSGQVTFHLKRGWEFTTTYQGLLDAGKRLRSAIDAIPTADVEDSLPF